MDSDGDSITFPLGARDETSPRGGILGVQVTPEMPRRHGPALPKLYPESVGDAETASGTAPFSGHPHRPLPLGTRAQLSSAVWEGLCLR